MPYFLLDIKDKTTMEGVAPHNAAKIMELDVDEILWCLEEHDRCDTDDYIYYEAYSKAEIPLGPDEEDEEGDDEWD
jgi:hypothetical protein